MKILASTYTFDASAQTIDCASFTSLEKIQLITNVTDNVIIYNFADSTKGGTLASTVLTLAYDTTSMSDADKLQIFVDDGNTSIPVTNAALTSLADAINSDKVDVNIASGNISGFATSAKQDTLIGHVDGVEGLLTTIDADTSSLSTKINTIAGAVSGSEMQVDVLTLPTATVQATNLDIRDLTSASDSVEVKQATGTNLHTVVDSGTITSITNAVAVTGTFYQATQPVSGTVTANLSATDNAVLDTIAAKDFATQTTLAAMNAKMVTGTDIGDVTINNASGASAVNIQDGGNTITVDGTVAVTNAGITTIAGAVAGTEMQVDVVTMPTTTVQATNLDIRDLTNASDSIAIYGSDDGGTTKRIIKTDSGGAIQIDLEVASVTANAGTNLNTSALALESGGNLAAIKAKTDNIPAQGQALAAGSLPVVLPAAQITTLTPPAAITGFATSAKQDTIIGHVDGVEALLGTIDADTSNISTKIDTLAGAVSATHVQVDVLTAPTTAVTGPLTDTQLRASAVPVSLASVPSHAVTNAGTFATQVTSIAAGDNNIGNVDIASALPAGTNAIGKLAANSGVDIGDVDVLSLPAIPAGTNAIGKILPPDVDVTAHTNYTRKYYTSAGAATDGIIWSPAAGKRWHVTSLIFQTSADATITFEDDKAGGDDPVLKGEFKAGSGMALTFDEKYPFASGEDAADLTVTTSAGNVYISVIGYEI